MARIYIARSTGIGSFERHVVLKMILPERAQDETSVQMFLNEARLAASLNHQNVAQVFEVGKEAGIHFLAMEYVHGQDLRALLAKAGSSGTRVPLELALTVVAGAAAGLEHAHERRNSDGTPMGIVHRDVSPSNIMIGYDGAVKLLDFGIAKATARSIETQSGIIKGKFAYMAPEQCRGREVDRRSDVFSLGIIVYEVTTQHRCFRADSDFDTMHRIVTGDIVRPTRLVQGYPQALEAIVLKALAVDPAQRYQSAGLLLEALESFAVAARMPLSTMSLGRFMRETFGDIPEPWLASSRPSQPMSAREQTISNTSASGEQAGVRAPSAPPMTLPVAASPVVGPPPAPGAAPPSLPSSGAPSLSPSLSSSGAPRASAPSLASLPPPGSLSSPGLVPPSLPPAGSASPSSGAARSSAGPLSAAGAPRPSVPSLASPAMGAPVGSPAVPVSGPAAVPPSVPPPVPRPSASSSGALPLSSLSAPSASLPGSVSPASSSASRTSGSSLALPAIQRPSVQAAAPSGLPPQHEQAPLHLPPDVALDLPSDAPVDAAGRAEARAEDYASAIPGHAGAALSSPVHVGLAMPSVHAAAAAPQADARRSSPGMPALSAHHPGAAAGAPLAASPFADPSRSGSGPAHGAYAPATQSSVRDRQSFASGPAVSRSELHPRFDLPDPGSDVSLRPANRLLYLGLGAVLVGIIVLLVISILDGPDELPAPPRREPSAQSAPASSELARPDPGRAAVAVTPVAAQPGGGALQPEAVKPEAFRPEPGAHGGSDAPGRPSAPPQIRLHVESTPAGAEVSLAGKPIGTTPLDVETERRSTTELLTIHRTRYQDVTATVDLSRDYAQAATLTPIPTPQAARQAAADRDLRPVVQGRAAVRDGRARTAPAGGSPSGKEDCQPPDRINPFENACHGHVCKPCPATP